MAYKRYIEACELAETIENLDIKVAGKSARWYDAKYSVLKEIAQSPTADVTEVKHGEWEENGGFYRCSKCINYANYNYDYCPYCGAKMKLK